MAKSRTRWLELQSACLHELLENSIEIIIDALITIVIQLMC